MRKKMVMVLVAAIVMTFQLSMPVMAKVIDVPKELTVDDAEIQTVHPEVELIGVYKSKDAEITSRDMSAVAKKQNLLETSEEQIEEGCFYDCLMKVVLPESLHLSAHLEWYLDAELNADFTGHELRVEAKLGKSSISNDTISGEGESSARLQFAEGVESLRAMYPTEFVPRYPGDECANPYDGRKISSTYCYIDGVYDGLTGSIGCDSDGHPIASAYMRGDMVNWLSMRQDEIYLMIRVYAAPVEDVLK